MSWVPPSVSGSYEPQSRTAPRPAAAAPAFTFGRYVQETQQQQQQQQEQRGQEQKQRSQAPASISSRPDRANFDPPVETLRWWQQPRNAATVSGTSNQDVEAFWAAARRDGRAVAELRQVEARLANKAQGGGSTVAASLSNREERSMAGVSSSYKDGLCAAHVKVGKRGVALAPEAMAAYEESRKQAQRNKEVGKATNMKISLF